MNSVSTTTLITRIAEADPLAPLLSRAISWMSDAVWGPWNTGIGQVPGPLVLLLLGVGLFLTVRSRFVQVRRFPEAVRTLVPKQSGSGGVLTPFQAFASALACAGMASAQQYQSDFPPEELRARWNGVFDRNVRDSGAVMVGAGTPTGRIAEWFTNYGSRVDLEGWGSSVTTTGYGDLWNTGPDSTYTAGFNGTSSATPIVTGSVAFRARLQCALCACEFERSFDEPLNAEFVSYEDAGGEEALGGDDLDRGQLRGNWLDLLPVVRDAIHLAVPMAPECKPRCKGLCKSCGANLNEGPCECSRSRRRGRPAGAP